MPWSPMRLFDEAAVREAPEVSGVYAIHQKGIVIDYGVAVGEGGIQGRLEYHLTRERNTCLQLARERETKVSWHPTDDPESMIVTLMERFRQMRSRLPRCNQCEPRWAEGQEAPLTGRK